MDETTVGKGGATRGLEDALGVTRVARVTGLDRSGVEVACAIRPGGHVLQVCNGKGESFEQARQGALLEAAELFASERVDPTALVWGSRVELQARLSDEIWGAEELGEESLAAPLLWSPEARMAWCRGVELFREVPVLVPAQLVHCPPSGSPPLGPAFFAWTTNGMGAHPDLDAARLHALLEAVERDQLARALPDGWSRREVGARLLDKEGLAEHCPRTAARLASLEEVELSAWLFDLAPKRGRIDLPVAGALLFDKRGGPVPLTAGYACRLDRDEALLAALLEAAQSRLTDIHGARDDVDGADRNEAETLAGWCRKAKPQPVEAVKPPLVASAAEAVREVLARLKAAGHEAAAAVELSPPGFEVHVVKAVVPGLLLSELL